MACIFICTVFFFYYEFMFLETFLLTFLRFSLKVLSSRERDLCFLLPSCWLPDFVVVPAVAVAA